MIYEDVIKGFLNIENVIEIYEIMYFISHEFSLYDIILL